ncbi:MAG: recombinase family protein [Chloroflexota bacterium]|nr:recombinase family protein [Chloroflexota bacterium]
MPADDGVAAYVRVSSASQGSAMQRDAIDRAATARGDRVGRWYTDTRTGATMQRSDLDELRRSARMGRIRRLYVFRLDRLTRSGIRDTLELVEELRRHGCELVTIADGFDLGGPAAEVVLAVMAWAAQLERLAINERISAARARVEAKGGSWGRPSRLSEAERRRVLELAAKGKSRRAIAVALKIPHATVGRVIAVAQKVPTKTMRPGPLKRKGKQGAAR